MSATENRKAGKRVVTTNPGKTLLDATLGIHTSDPGEKRVNMQGCMAIQKLWDQHPAVAAARTVLHGQLLGGGLSLMRNGQEISLKPAFKTHLEESWMPFAKDIIDSFVKFGLSLIHISEPTRPY